MVVGSEQVTDRPHIVNHLCPVTDILKSQACHVMACGVVQVEGQGVGDTVEIENKLKVGALFVPFWVEVW